ncbi:MAG: hypothetical protein ACJA2G_001939 [Cognaticolwellia sp.]|jgi:hypothetical protein
MTNIYFIKKHGSFMNKQVDYINFEWDYVQRLNIYTKDGFCKLTGSNVNKLISLQITHKIYRVHYVKKHTNNTNFVSS